MGQILRLLIKLYESLDSPDYFSITQCFVYLNDPSLASALLNSLLKLDDASAAAPKDEEILTAYQIAFDLAETATQEFLQVVRTSVEGPKSEAQPAEGGAEATTLRPRRARRCTGNGWLRS
jgi:26S proteasome regulatory subunit N2